MKNVKSVWHWAVSVALALGLTAGLMAVTATAEEKAEGKGSLVGKVTDKDGNAVAGAEVLLFKAPERGAGKAKKDGAAVKAERKAKKQADDAVKPENKPEKKKPEPVATATTDSDGKFAFKNLEAGNYGVRTRVRGSGAANAKATVAAGGTAEVSLQLAAGKKKEPGVKNPDKKAEKKARKEAGAKKEQ